MQVKVLNEMDQFNRELIQILNNSLFPDLTLSRFSAQAIVSLGKLHIGFLFL